MISALVEDPMPVIFFGILVEAALGVMLVRTGRGVLLWAMIGVALLVLGCVGLERLVVTETERVEATLDDAAAAVLADDPPGLLRCISPSAGYTERWLADTMRRYKFDKIKFRDLKISINRLVSPPSADARFTAIVGVRDTQSAFSHPGYPVSMTVQLRLEQDRWLVAHHTIDDVYGR